MNQECEGRIRQIVARAVCARGKKRFVKNHLLKPDHRPDEILGYWVGNHQYSAKSFQDCVVISGKYDITVWYSYEDQSKTDLLKQAFTYSEQISLEELEGRLIREEEVLVTERIEPTCIEVKINDENIGLEVETAFTVEIIGEAKMTIVAYPSSILESEEEEEFGCEEDLNSAAIFAEKLSTEDEDYPEESEY